MLQLHLEIFTPSGRCVLSRDLGQGDGAGETNWDGLDARGRALPGGVYLARVSTGATGATARLVLLK